MQVAIIEARPLVLSLAAVTAVEATLAWVASPAGNSMLLFLGAARLLQIMFLALIVISLGGGLPSLGLARETTRTGLVKGLRWSFFFGLGAGLILVLMSLSGINPIPWIHNDLPHDPARTVLFFVVGGLIAPVAEEIFFRGIIYGFLRRWGIAAALTGSTALFAGAHPAPGVPITQIVGGLVFGAAYEKEGNLLVPMTIHVLGNTAIFALSAVWG